MIVDINLKKEVLVITINHLHKSYGTKNQRLHVLKDVSFTLPEGSLACLLGPSGSGKSTLLNILGGIVDAS